MNTLDRRKSIFEAKHSIVWKFISKQSEHVYVIELKNRSEANWFILKLNSIEAKRTGSIVILYLKSRKKGNFRFFKNERQKIKVFDNELSKVCHS
jgi:hypothetical protein